MSKSTKVSNPNAKGGSGFLWAILAVVVIAAVVIGYIVISGQGKKTDHLAEREYVNVGFEGDFSDNAMTLRAEDAGADAEVVDLYEDYSCPYCSTLALETDEQMKNAVEAGDLVVNIRTLNFLDRGNTDGHSTKAAAAIAAVAESGDTDLYWNYRSALMEEQEDIFNQWSNDDFADAAKAIGAGDDVVEAIRSGAHQEDAVAMTTANAEKLQAETGEVSSPRVVQDGQDVQVDDINQWIDAVLQS